MMEVYIATEDALSEAVALRLVEQENEGMHVAVRLGRRGNGYLKRNLLAFTQIARRIPVLLLTDLDRVDCPAVLIEDWRGNAIFPGTLLFRVVVHEIEAWLLADREGFAQFSGVPLHRMPEYPERLDDPKETLLNLIRRHGTRIAKADILPEGGSTVRVGLAYNEALCGFVRGSWSPGRASRLSHSLDRTRRRLHEMRTGRQYPQYS
jgi:hypothetical protein